MSFSPGATDVPLADAAEESDRAARRHRRIAVNVVVATLAKVASFAINLLLIPVLLGHLGGERFGIWATITSFVMLLTFADLGVGNGLMTAVAQASARGDNAELRRLTTAGFAATLAFAGALASIALLLAPVIPWGTLLHAPSSEISEISDSVVVLGLCLALAMPANIASRVETGLQRGFIANLVQLTGAALALAGNLVAVREGGGLPWLVAASVGLPAAVSMINSLVFFFIQRPDLRPSRANFSWSVVRSLLRLGGLFLVLQIAASFAISSDNLIVSHALGPAAVTNYSIPAKLYALISVGMTLALSPLWPAYGEAVSRGDHRWVRQTLLRTMALAFGMAMFVGAAISVLMPFILRIWVGGRIDVSTPFMVAMVAAAALESLRVAVVMYLNGSAVIGFQILVDISFALLCVGVRVLLIPIVGSIAIPIGSCIALLIAVLGPYFWFLSKRFRTALASS